MQSKLDFLVIDADVDDLDVEDSDLVGYFRPQDVLDSPELSSSRKRALLAHWASDRHAVAGAPALRCVRGVTASIADILTALKQVDQLAGDVAPPQHRPSQHAAI